MAKSFKGLGLIAVTGGPNCGKERFATELEGALFSGHTGGFLSRIKMAAIIDWALALRSPLGKEVRGHTEDIRHGRPLSDGLVAKVHNAWLEAELARNIRLRTLMLVGAPRNEQQLKLMQQFGRPFLINMTGHGHADDARRQEHARFANVLQTAGAPPILHLNYSDSPEQLLRITLESIQDLGDKAPLTAGTVKEALRRLDLPNHQAGRQATQVAQLT